MKLNLTNNNNVYDNSHKKIYSKPYFKKEESKGYFTSNKKKDNESKYKCFHKYNKNNNNADELRFSLKKKLLFDEDDDF